MSNPAQAKVVLWGTPGGTPTDVPLALWGVGTARALRAHWMLTELEVPYISHRIQSRSGETFDPAYLKLNPRHKIPTLQHGALTLSESAAIIQYLLETFAPPDGLFVPADCAQRAKVNEWCYFIMNELDGHTLYVIRRHLGLKHIYGEAPEAVAARTIALRPFPAAASALAIASQSADRHYHSRHVGGFRIRRRPDRDGGAIPSMASLTSALAAAALASAGNNGGTSE